MTILENFIAGGWQKKAPAQEDARAYTFQDKVSQNISNNQIFSKELEHVCDTLRNDDTYWSDGTASYMMQNEQAPTTVEEELHISAPLKSLHQVPTLPIEGLPRFFQNYCENVTDTYQCPREFVLGAMFSAISTAVGDRVRISTPKYKMKPMSVWIATVAPSGSNKSEPVEEVMKPLIKINERLDDEYTQKEQEINRNGNGEPLPTLKRLLLSGDVTPEARTEALSNNPQGMCLYEDEVSTIFLNQNRYNQNAGVIDLLKVWDGRSVQCDRKNKDSPSLLIKRSFLNILGNIQPEYIKDIFGEKRYIATGFNARWNFLFHDEVSDEPLNDSVCEQHLCDKWDWAINALQTILEGQELRIEGEAYEIYRQYHTELQEKKKGKDSYERSIYAKLQIQVLRLAGIVHYMSVLGDTDFCGEPLLYDTLQVSSEEMRYAVSCMDYFEHTGKKVMNILRPSKKEGARLNNKQLIKLMFERFTIPNKAAFADSISVSRPYVSGIVNEKQ